MSHNRECIEWGPVSNRIFFEQDFTQLSQSPPFDKRVLINFFVNSVAQNDHQRLSAWMTSKWDELSTEIKQGFINRIIVFFQDQTVIQGETGFSISTKVKYNIT